MNLLQKLCCKYPKLCPYVRFLGFLIAWVMLACMDIVIKSVSYPLLYEMIETSGIIENEYYEENDVRIKHRETNVYTYYCTVDGRTFTVTPRQIKGYEEGDEFPYYCYKRDDKVIYSATKYTLWGAIKIIIFYVLVLGNIYNVFKLTEEERAERERKKIRSENNKPLKKIDYNRYNANESEQYQYNGRQKEDNKIHRMFLYLLIAFVLIAMLVVILNYTMIIRAMVEAFL